MITKFLAGMIAGVSEKMLIDLFEHIIREITLKQKKAGLDRAVADLKAVIDKVAVEGANDDEKNAQLILSGRAAVDRLRGGK